MHGNGIASRVRLANSLFVLSAFLFLVALGSPAVWSQEVPPKAVAPQTTPPDPAIERGHSLFMQSCAFCHGPDATGARAPDLVRSPLLAHDVKADKIGEVIRLGRVDKGMPALPLTDPQILDIAAYLHARAEEAMKSSHVSDQYPLEKLLTGNPAAGMAYFNGPGGCRGCHSPTGDLATVATKYSPLDLQSHMLYPGGKHTIAVVTLPSGEQVKGPVVHADDFVIGLRDASGWYRSFLRDRVKIELQDGLAAHRELLDKLTQENVHNLFAYLASLK
jgi:cytochrome c oxidase cbb3-type subunit III